MKRCITCQNNKLLTEFYFKKSIGYYSSKCKECEKNFAKQYRANNKNKVSLYNKNYKEENKEILVVYNKKYYQENRESRLNYSKQYHKSNKEVLNEKCRIYSEKSASKLLRNARLKKRKQTDVIFKLRHDIGRTIADSFKKINIKKSGRAETILGCSILEFQQYIEKQFEPWMNWKNHGQYNKNKETWQLDHILPISLAKTEEEVIKLSYYKNFRPLRALDNLLKGNKII